MAQSSVPKLKKYRLHKPRKFLRNSNLSIVLTSTESGKTYVHFTEFGSSSSYSLSTLSCEDTVFLIAYARILKLLPQD